MCVRVSEPVPRVSSYVCVGIMPSLWNEQFEVENSCKDCNYERVEEVLYRRKI